MTAPLSRTAALQFARKFGSIVGTPGRWGVIAPAYADRPSGPTTDLPGIADHAGARFALAAARAEIALCAMGYGLASVASAVGMVTDGVSDDGPRDLRAIVRAALDRLDDGDLA